jgi:hypothetical protein
MREAKSEYRSSPTIEGPQVTFISDNKVLYYMSDQSEPTTVVLESKKYAEQSSKLFTHLWSVAHKI